MKKEFSEKLKNAIKDYYSHCESQKEIKWDKKADRNAIAAASIKDKNSGIKTFEAIAGTFFFTWADDQVTTHDKNNWEEMVLLEEKYPEYAEFGGGTKTPIVTLFVRGW